MATDTRETKQISWDLQDSQEKLRLLTLLIVDGQPADYTDILAGIEDVGIAVEPLIEIAGSLPADTQVIIALATKSKPIAEALVSNITSIDLLVNLTLNSKSVHARKNAVLAIHDHAALTRLRDELAGKDKTVCRILEEKLAAERLATTEKDQRAAHEIETEPVAESAEPPTEINPKQDLPEIEKELDKLSFKNTARLNGLQNTINRLRRMVADSKDDLEERTENLHGVLEDKLKKNKNYQDILKQSTEDLLANLQKALEEGQSHDALPTWDKIQGNISNTSGKLRIALQSSANQYKSKLIELRDWKVFAATEKKKELIKKMQHLLESKMHASEKSKYIGSMHKEWKVLGRSNQNEELWREFKKVSDEAYEPCKAYFTQRKRIMISNLKARREICEKLEAGLTATDNENINISALNKLLHSSDQEWKQYAPIEQSKIKSLQKRFYAVVNHLRRLRKNALRHNGKQKQSFITEASKLSELEDNQKAMNEAKRLQREWKNIGPTSYKEDKKYWEEFRVSCDKIFAKRNQEIDAARATLQETGKELQKILDSLTKIGELEDIAFRGSRTEYQDLQQSFSAALDSKTGKQHKKLLDGFNNLKLKIDTRFKTLPDKKWQNLKNTIIEKAQFLKSLESELFASKDNNQFESVKAKLENGTWNELPNSGNQNFDTALQNRANSIRKVSSVSEFLNLAKESEQQIRSLCIELEIRANIDTPDEDQPLRMQIQLDQLKTSFGQMKPDRKANTRYAQDLELQAYCIGPLDQNTQASLFSRLEQAAKKLL